MIMLNVVLWEPKVSAQKSQKFSAKEDEHTDIHCIASWRYKYEKQTWNLSMLTLFYIFLQAKGENEA